MLKTLIGNLEEMLANQEDMNNCYDLLTNFILTEAENSCEKRSKPRPTTVVKEYWDSDLSKKWRTMKESERIYRKCKKEGNYRRICDSKLQFNEDRKCFDKLLKYRKRQYHKGLMIEINECCDKDPNAFWEFINQLGPKRSTKIPWEVTVNGEIKTDKQSMLEHWRCEFEKLYRSVDGHFNDEFKLQQKETLTFEQISTVNNSEYTALNKDFCLNEIKKAINNSKFKKAVGLDEVSNELLRSEAVATLLHSLFKTCLHLQLIPDI